MKTVETKMDNSRFKFRAWNNGLMYSVSELIWQEGGLKFYGPGVGSGIIEANPKHDWEVDTILMPYTGLKDKNKEIYEGDIVLFGRTTCLVRWSNTLLRWILDAVKDGVVYNEKFLLNSTTEVEIIGNIYENPELL